MNVLSLFDGMSCGRIALERAGIKVDKYFENGDCIHTKCIFYVTNDHNASTDQSEDQAITFKFSGINLF